MMPTTLLWFLGASMALTIAPGPDNVFVVTQGLSRGRKAALLTAWGMISGITVHTIAAAAGIRVDTLRFYQGRGLVPAPTRVGRVAIYGEQHLERLRRIVDWFDRYLRRAGTGSQGRG